MAIEKLMKKILIFIIIIITILVVSLLFVLISHQSQSTLPTFFPTPTPIPGQPTGALQKSLYVVATEPSGTATDAPLDKPIIITFNKDITPTDFTFTIKPNFDYTTNIQGRTFIVTPNNPLPARITYEYFIDYNNGQQPDIHFFTTAGEGQAFPNKNSNFRSLLDNSDSKYAPDVYLSNKIEDNSNTNTDFSVTYDYTPAPEGHFYFIVTSNIADKNQAKQEFLDWVKSTGLTDQQIQTLDIKYL